MLSLISRFCLGEVVVDAGAVDPAILAENLGDRSLQNIISTGSSTRGTVSGSFTVGLVF